MGMDVYGTKPSTTEGEYFRNSIWSWRPLATYICEVAPQIAVACTYWQSNDGDGLNEAGSIALADALQAEIDSGRTAAYALRYRSEQEKAPNEKCFLCEGTGTRKPVPERGAGDQITGIRCNNCQGEGYVRPMATNYPFRTENVREFVAFLRGCGGFRIN
jgi:hypothetical protein